MKRTERLMKRTERLMPGGIPKYARIYDNGGETTDRFTVVYSGRYPKSHGSGWLVVGMSGAPFFAQGVCLHSEYPGPVDTIRKGVYTGWFPAMGKKCYLGKRISFQELPEDCKKVVLQDYEALWAL